MEAGRPCCYLEGQGFVAEVGQQGPEGEAVEEECFDCAFLVVMVVLQVE